jgi:hypothetical protein
VFGGRSGPSGSLPGCPEPGRPFRKGSVVFRDGWRGRRPLLPGPRAVAVGTPSAYVVRAVDVAHGCTRTWRSGGCPRGVKGLEVPAWAFGLRLWAGGSGTFHVKRNRAARSHVAGADGRSTPRLGVSEPRGQRSSGFGRQSFVSRETAAALPMVSPPVLSRAATPCRRGPGLAVAPPDGRLSAANAITSQRRG